MGAHTMDHIVQPLSCVLGFVLPDIDATAFLAAVNELAKVFGAILPSLVTLPMLHSVPPHATVELTSIFLLQDTVPTKLAHCPATLVAVSVRQCELSLMRWLVECPTSSELRSVRVEHRSSSMPHTPKPLPSVSSSIACVPVLWAVLDLLPSHRLFLSKGLGSLLFGEVFAKLDTRLGL